MKVTIPNFILIRPVGGTLKREGSQTHMKLTDAFLHYANAPYTAVTLSTL